MKVLLLYISMVVLLHRFTEGLPQCRPAGCAPIGVQKVTKKIEIERMRSTHLEHVRSKNNSDDVTPGTEPSSPLPPPPKTDNGEPVPIDVQDVTKNREIEGMRSTHSEHMRSRNNADDVTPSAEISSPLPPPAQTDKGESVPIGVRKVTRTRDMESMRSTYVEHMRGKDNVSDVTPSAESSSPLPPPAETDSVESVPIGVRDVTKNREIERMRSSHLEHMRSKDNADDVTLTAEPSPPLPPPPDMYNGESMSKRD